MPMPPRPRFLALALPLLAACGGDPLDLNLQVDSARGLKAGSPVLLGGQDAGRVTAVEPNPAGGYIAKLAVRPEFRERLTEGSQFQLVPDPWAADQRRIEVAPGQPDAPPLADHATVRSTLPAEPAYGFDQLLRGFAEGFGVVRERLERFRSQLERLPQSAEAQELQDQWARLQAEMQKAQEATEDSVKRDWIPKLQKEMDALEKRLEDLRLPAPRQGRTI